MDDDQDRIDVGPVGARSGHVASSANPRSTPLESDATRLSRRTLRLEA